MKLNAYGKLLEVVREGDEWVTYEYREGKRRAWKDIAIPAECDEAGVILYLEDILYENASPRQPKLIVIER